MLLHIAHLEHRDIISYYPLYDFIIVDLGIAIGDLGFFHYHSSCNSRCRLDLHNMSSLSITYVYVVSLIFISDHLSVLPIHCVSYYFKARFSWFRYLRG
jgi:hypothetical protein